METRITALAQELRQALKSIKDNEQLEALRVKYFGRKNGVITRLLGEVGDLSLEAKRRIGVQLNELKAEATAEFARLKKELGHGTTSVASVDVTAGFGLQERGHLHPISQMTYRIWDIFRSLNFTIYETPDIETDYNNFEALNMPPDHPARDMQDTFYLAKGLLLKTHATSFQPRVMKTQQPPIRAINTGNCFRRDSDVSHSPMFHQFDGICVDRGITMTHLKGTLEVVMRQLLEDPELKVRFRTSYFPFVEPGAEFDVSCSLCSGRGCTLCKQTGWLEMGGCGMIHPNVFKEVGIDAQEYSGWAFGFGIERPLMIKHHIPDIRLLFQNDVRFLNQF